MSTPASNFATSLTATRCRFLSLLPCGLLLALACPTLAFAELQQAQQVVEVEALYQSPLDYLNSVRQKLALAPLKSNATLDRAAESHVRYLQNNQQLSHQQQRGKAYFSGETPADRALASGYQHRHVAENFSTAAQHIDAVDRLMAAIYHRFSLLSQEYDESGYAQGQETEEHFPIHLWLLGNSQLNRYCEEAQHNSIRPLYGAGHYLQGLCRDETILIAEANYRNITAGNRRSYTHYPIGERVPIIFTNEEPDPLPYCEITSSPVSIDFHLEAAPVRMLSFEIRDEQQKLLRDTILLNAQNDPQQRLNAGQFALYSRQPFEFGKYYSVTFRYRQNEQEKTAKWSFRTAEPPYPYFIYRQGDSYAIEPDKHYAMYFPPQDCHDIITSIEYRYPKNSHFSMRQLEENIILFKASGRRGDRITLTAGNRQAELILQNSSFHEKSASDSFLDRVLQNVGNLLP